MSPSSCAWPRNYGFRAARASLCLAEALRRALSLPRQSLPQNKAPMTRQWGENTARTLHWHFPRKRSGALHIMELSPLQLVPMPGPRDCTPPAKSSAKIQTPSSAQPWEGECSGGPSPLGSGCCGELGGTPRFHPCRACNEKLFLRQKKIQTRGWGGYRSKLMAFFIFACHR